MKLPSKCAAQRRVGRRLPRCFAFQLAAAACAALASGCSSEPTATILGTVKIDGQPLPAGMVVFEGQGFVGAGVIEAGAFLASEIPPGNYAVSILPPPVETKVDPQTTEIRAVTTIDDRLYPERYRLASTSGLQYTAQPGENTFDISLTVHNTRSTAP